MQPTRWKARERLGTQSPFLPPIASTRCEWSQSEDPLGLGRRLALWSRPSTTSTPLIFKMTSAEHLDFLSDFLLEVFQVQVWHDIRVEFSYAESARRASSS